MLCHCLAKSSVPRVRVSRNATAPSTCPPNSGRISLAGWPRLAHGLSRMLTPRSPPSATVYVLPLVVNRLNLQLLYTPQDASGRLTDALPDQLCPRRFRRIEVGVRIEQPADEFFLKDFQELDPKFLEHIATGVQWRTFCCCREGLVVETELAGVRSFSGRADCPPTGRSNVGLNLRFLTADAVPDDLAAALSRRSFVPICVPFRDVVDGSAEGGAVDTLFGSRTARMIREALTRIESQFDGVSFDAAGIYAPTIEGVGTYPVLAPDLRVAGSLPLWVAGDSTGMFRGSVHAR